MLRDARGTRVRCVTPSVGGGGGGSVGKLKADVSGVSPSSERIKKLRVALDLYRERWSLAIGRNMAT